MIEPSNEIKQKISKIKDQYKDKFNIQSYMCSASSGENVSKVFETMVELILETRIEVEQKEFYR